MMQKHNKLTLSSSTTSNDQFHQIPFRVLMVVPTLGERLDTIRRTLLSIRQQTGVDVDIVVVAKNVSADLASIGADLQVNIITHPGHISAAVNAGFATATQLHKYVGWLGDDDMLRPGALADAYLLMESNPSAAVVYGTCDYVDVNGDLLFERRPPPYAPVLLQFVPGLIKQEACLFRLSAFRQAGGLDEQLRYTMDLDILLKMSKIGVFVKSERTLAAFCWHAGSLTIANRTVSLDEAQSVQGRHASGIVKWLYLILKYPIRYLILVMSWNINRNMRNAG